MEVRPDILKKLLCSVCGEYLSCAPVRIKNDGAALCGRCSDPEGELTLRITPYEDLVEMFLFQCANKTHGCTETLYMSEMKDHEEECEYKQYACPVTESGQCDWSGARKNILDHCKEQHSDNMLQNSAFQMLFIIQCKVCTTAKNICHSVRLIGKSALANNYEYVLTMVNKRKELTMRQDVAPQGCMALQEDMSVHVDFNTIQKFLGDFKDTIFKNRIGRKCVECEECAIESAWPTDEGWCCKDCAPITRQCKNRNYGCSYTDTDKKVSKHEVFYCQYSTRCAICNKRVNNHLDHYSSAHSDVAYKAGAIWRAEVVTAWEYFNIFSNIGKLWCKYILKDSQFILAICTPMHTEQLSDYRCVVKLTNPDTGHSLRKILPITYSEQEDWQLILNEDDFLMYVNNGFDMKIGLLKYNYMSGFISMMYINI